jgi:RimJ/RimL family protein N-acetyltransferase
MHVITGTDKDSIGLLIAGYFARNTGYPTTGPYTAMGWIKNGKMVAQAIFHDYTDANIEVHFNGPNNLTRKSIGDIANYVFKQLGCARLTAKPYCTNEKISRVVEKIGFKYEATHKNYYKDEKGNLVDAVCYVIDKDTGIKWAR